MNIENICILKQRASRTMPDHWVVITPAGWGIVKHPSVEDGLRGLTYNTFLSWQGAVVFVVSAIDEGRVKPFKRGHEMRVPS